MKKENSPQNRKFVRVSTLKRNTDIYEKALDLFAKKGYDATSMSMIAKVLKMNKANLYYYCSGKEDLLYQAHKYFLEKYFVSIVDEAERLSNPLDRITFFLRKVILMNTSNNIGQILLHGFRSLNKSHLDEIRLIWMRAYHLFYNAIKELCKSRRARNFRESFITFTAFGMINWIFYWFDYSRQANAEELAETMIAIFLNGILIPVNQTR